MKKSLLLLIAFIALFFSCSGDLETSSGTKDSADGKTYLVIGGASFERTIMSPSDASVNNLKKISLKGTISGGTEETLVPADKTEDKVYSETYSEFSKEIENPIEIEPGTWEFTLSAELEGIAFSCTKENVSIEAGKENTVSFELVAVNDAGGLNITLNFPMDKNIERIEAILETADGDAVDAKGFTDSNGDFTITEIPNGDETEKVYSVTYSHDIDDAETILESGTYHITFNFYATGISEPINSPDYYVRIARGFTTVSKPLVSLNETYSINYVANGGELVSGESQPMKYFRRSVVELPKMKKDGYVFMGWYEDKNFTKPIERIEKDSTGDKTVYAAFINSATENFSVADTEIKIEMKEHDTLYLNSGSIEFITTIEDVPFDPSALSAKLYYGGYALDESYYTFKNGVFSIGGTDKLVAGGTYQLYVTAQKTLESVTISGNATFDIEVENKVYYSVVVDETIDNSSSDYYKNYLAEKMKEVSTPSVVKVTGVGVDTVYENYTYTTYGTLKNISEAIQGKSSSYNNLVYPVELDCSELTGVTKISEYDIGAVAISSIELPATIETICKQGFDMGSQSVNSQDYYSKLASIEIPEGVTTIESEAFYYCKNLASVTIPETVSEIGSGPFSNCTSLAKIIVAEENNNYYTNAAGTMMFEKTGADSAKIVLAIGKIDTLDFSSGELSTVTEIAANAFANLTIGEISNFGNVSTIGKNAFAYCKLTSVTLNKIPENFPDSYNCIFYQSSAENLTIDFDMTSENYDSVVKLISPIYTSGSGSYTYISRYGLTGIKNAVFNGSFYATNLADSAKDKSFLYNSKETLETLTFNGASTIGGNQFYYFSKLNSITFNDATGTSVIQGYAFYSADALKNLDLTGVKEIKADGFFACSALTEINIPKSLESIVYDSFDACSNIRKFTVDSENPNYSTKKDGQFLTNKDGDKLIRAVLSLAEVDFTDTGIKSIEIYAFRSNSLTSVNLTGVEHIGQQAFYNQTELTSVTFGDTLKSIGYNAFYRVPFASGVNLPSSVIAISLGAFRRLSTSEYPITTFTIGGISADAATTSQPTGWYKTTKENWNTFVATPPTSITESEEIISLPEGESTESVIQTIQNAACDSNSAQGSGYYYRLVN